MADPFVSIMEPLRVLCERAEEVLNKRGLTMAHVAITPGPPEGPHELTIIATLADTQPHVDDGFERVLREAREAEDEQRARQAEAELNERLRGSEGFLD